MNDRKERAKNIVQNLFFDKDTKNDLWITQCIYPRKRGGYFIEIGAANGTVGSSCFVLESRLGWTGICVEPHQDFFRDLVRNRPNSICENVCLSDKIGEVLFLEGIDEPNLLFYSGIKSNLERFKHDSDKILQNGRETIKESTTLENLLVTHNAPKVIDYAAFDIEGSELEVLRDFPFHKYQFSALSLECDGHIWDGITNLLTSNDYLEVMNPFKR